MQAKISIIIAVYNLKPYLRRCLDSVVNQTYQHLEIILVDDGSFDGSEGICDEYAEKDSRIKVIHKMNGGLSDARNAGLLVATGEYIGYVDGDDFVDHDMYEQMLAALIHQKGQIAVCRYRQVDEKGNEVLRIDHTNEVLAFSRIEALEIFLREDEKYKIMPSVWSKLFGREVIDGLTFAVGKTSEDIMYTTTALCQAKRVVYLDKCFYNYVVDRKDSIMNKKIGERRINNEISIWKEQIEFLQKKGYDTLSDKAAYYFYRRMLFYYIDFKTWNEENYAMSIINILKADRMKIKEIYRKSWIKPGDKVRMRTFLASPRLYHFLVRIYERYIIPVRVKREEIS